MPVRKANAVWKGTLKKGEGSLSVESGAFKGQKYTFSTRFENQPGTNPEELIGAAHAGCFSQAFSLEMEKAGYNPEEIRTEAAVSIEPEGDGFAIKSIVLTMEAKVPGIEWNKFKEIAEGAKKGCPVSKALSGGPEISLNAKLLE